jgi:hypothetical protein
MVPSPAIIDAFAVGRVIVTVPRNPLLQSMGMTRVADLQFSACPRQVDFPSEILNFTFSCVAPNVVDPLPYRPDASTYWFFMVLHPVIGSVAKPTTAIFFRIIFFPVWPLIE